MKINDKNQPFIYIRTTGEKIPVSREVRDACYGEAARIRMREQADGHCLCPQSEVWVCDGDCLICEHRRFGDLISLDVPVSEDGEDTLLNVVPSDAPSIESVIADRDLLDRLFARLRELDPDADTMIAMWQDDYKVSDRAIAKALGRPQRAFADQMKRYRTELRRIRDF
nr:sigma-70 family RNA polymerase sigma factor [uncultured Oscillibacter sp.]